MKWYHWRLWRFAFSPKKVYGQVRDEQGYWKQLAFGIFFLTKKIQREPGHT